jgi:hypothetical protein
MTPRHAKIPFNEEKERSIKPSTLRKVRDRASGRHSCALPHGFLLPVALSISRQLCHPPKGRHRTPPWRE